MTDSYIIIAIKSMEIIIDGICRAFQQYIKGCLLCIQPDKLFIRSCFDGWFFGRLQTYSLIRLREKVIIRFDNMRSAVYQK